MKELFNLLSGLSAFEVMPNFPGVANPDEDEDDFGSIQDNEEDTDNQSESLDISEKLKDEAWANQPVTLIVDGETVQTTRGNVYRDRMKGLSGDKKLKEAHDLERSVADLMGGQPDRPDPFAADIHAIADSVRKDKDGKPKSRSLTEIFSDEKLSVEERIAEAAPILEQIRNRKAQAPQTDSSVRQELDTLRAERDFEQRTKTYLDQIKTDWKEVVKEMPHLDDPSIQDNILAQYDFYDKLVHSEAKAVVTRALAQGYSPQQIRTAWPRIKADAQAKFGRSMLDCAKSFEQGIKARNKKVTEKHRFGTAGPGSAPQPRDIRGKLVDKNGNPLIMGTPEYDRKVEEILRQGR